MFKIKKLKKVEKLLFYSIFFSILILSLGLGMIGADGKFGSFFIILGSSIFYAGVIILAFLIIGLYS